MHSIPFQGTPDRMPSMLHHSFLFLLLLVAFSFDAFRFVFVLEILSVCEHFKATRIFFSPGGVAGIRLLIDCFVVCFSF